MPVRTIKLPSLTPPAPGAKTSVKLPLGPTYYKVKFTATSASAGLAVGAIGQIEVLFNGKTKMKFANLQRLIDINTYYGRTTDSVTASQVEFTLHFFRAELMDIIYQRLPGIGTQDLQTLHIEIMLDATAPADIQIVGEAQIDPIPQPVGAFYNVREYPFSSSVAGLVEVDKLVKGPFYAAMHLFKADVDSVIVEVNQNGDQVKVVDAAKTTLETLQKEAAPKARTPITAKATHVDFLLDGDLANALATDGLSDFRVYMELGSAGSMDIVTETLDTIAA